MAQKWTPAEIRAFYNARAPKLKQAGGTSAKEWRGPCPVHKGKRDSFAVNPATGEAYCHSSCGRGWSMVELERELGHASSLQEAAKSIRALIGGSTPMNGQPPKIVEVYPYTDAEGVLKYEVVRYVPKDFKQRQVLPDGQRVWNMKGVQLVLFRLPKVLKADEVYLCEGEKDAITIERFGHTGTTAPGGAEKWRDEYAVTLGGKIVHLLPDNDVKGLRHAAKVARSLIGKVRELRIIKMPSGKDVSEWAAAGGDEWQLEDLVQRARIETAESVDAFHHSLVPPAPSTAKHCYKLTNEGVIYEDPNPNMRPFKICGPLEIVAQTRNASSEDWGRWLRWKDPDGRPHQWAMPISVLAGDGRQVAERLLSGGLFLEPGPRARLHLNYYLLDESVQKRAHCVGRVGWHSQSFVLPDTTVGTESENILYQTTMDTEHYLSTSGTLDQWREKIAKPSSSNSRLILAINAAFAGPCLQLLGIESGGIHFCGVTSKGKSTTLAVGGSVCGGGGPNGFVQSWRATSNGLEAVAEIHNDMTLFLDELAQIDPKEAADIAYLLANGAGKARMTKSITQRRKLSWRLLFVSAGEVTLAEHANKGARFKGGAEIRLLNIEADAGTGHGIFETTHGQPPDEFARSLKAAALKYYGTPLRELLKQLAGERRGHWIQRLKVEQTEFMRNYNRGGSDASEISRAATRFAAIAAAGEVATEMGITGWKKGESKAAAGACFDSWLGMRGTVASSDIDAGLRQVQYFLEVAGASRFQVIRGGTADADAIVPNRAGFRGINSETGETEYIIPTEVWRREVCNGFDAKAIAAELLRRGHLEPGTDEAHMHTPLRRLPEMGQRRVYVVKASLLGE